MASAVSQKVLTGRLHWGERTIWLRRKLRCQPTTERCERLLGDSTHIVRRFTTVWRHSLSARWCCSLSSVAWRHTGRRWCSYGGIKLISVAVTRIVMPWRCGQTNIHAYFTYRSARTALQVIDVTRQPNVRRILKWPLTRCSSDTKYPLRSHFPLSYCVLIPPSTILPWTHWFLYHSFVSFLLLHDGEAVKVSFVAVNFSHTYNLDYFASLVNVSSAVFCPCFVGTQRTALCAVSLV